MSWFISLILASAVFSSEANLPAQNSFSYSNNQTSKTITLDETERFEQTYPLNANGKISVSNVNGSITIDTWDRNEVKLSAVKTADDKERLTEVEIKINARPDSLTVETNYEKQESTWSRKNYKYLTVEYTLTVPRNAVLNEIETVNGSVNIANSYNMTKASTVNGQVTATNLRGTANLSTVNGTVEANFDQLQSSSRISLNTVNGTVNLTIPSDANATVKADTVNGSITNEFGLPVRKGEYVGRDLYGKIGSGEVQIRLNSVNGGLYIKRKNDGKSVNPATNLLPAKNSDDNDRDDDDDSLVNVREMNKDIDKSMKDSEKDMSAELERSQKELEKAQKEFKKNQKSIVKINQEELKARIDEGMQRQREAMARLADVNFFTNMPSIEKKSETFNVKSTPKITVDARNCSVSVHGWDKSEVQYSITRVSKTRNQKPLSYTANHSDSEVKIIVGDAGKTSNNSYWEDLENIRVEVFVPKKSNLRILTNREIRLENVSGDLDLTGEEESVNVRDASGNLRVQSADGKIRVIGFKGEIEAQTGDGDMNLEGDFQKITATTGDGNIVVTLPDDASALIKANTESVCLDGIPPSRITTTDISEGSGLWRIGSGKSNYVFNVADGQVFVRSMSSLKAGI